MWQIIKSWKTSDMWQGKDAEGRKIYLRTERSNNGMATEPNTFGYYSQKQATAGYLEKV